MTALIETQIAGYVIRTINLIPYTGDGWRFECTVYAGDPEMPGTREIDDLTCRFLTEGAALAYHGHVVAVVASWA
jgi:hypothetical protein